MPRYLKVVIPTVLKLQAARRRAGFKQVIFYFCLFDLILAIASPVSAVESDTWQLEVLTNAGYKVETKEVLDEDNEDGGDNDDVRV